MFPECSLGLRDVERLNGKIDVGEAARSALKGNLRVATEERDQVIYS
jgi:hypothetical protein